MSESKRRRGPPSNGFKEQSCRFGLVVRALWPVKPALNLAQRANISERSAQYFIKGQRRPSARAALVVLTEIIE